MGAKGTVPGGKPFPAAPSVKPTYKEGAAAAVTTFSDSS